MKKKFLIATLLTCVCAFALFPALPVVDFGAIAELVSEVGWLAKQYSELVDTYTMITNEYNQLVTNAKWIAGKARWKATLTPWKLPTATNTYGTTGGWITAVDTGAGSPAGYSAAVTRLNDYSSVWGSIEATQQDQIGRNYATVELSDGATINALDQLGKIRGNSAAVEEAIDTLESDSLSDDPALNTEVGVLNEMNAAPLSPYATRKTRTSSSRRCSTTKWWRRRRSAMRRLRVSTTILRYARSRPLSIRST